MLEFWRVNSGMMNPAQQKWMELCERVIQEQDPERFLQLIVDINNMLWVKQNRLIAERSLKQEEKKVNE